MRKHYKAPAMKDDREEIRAALAAGDAEPDTDPQSALAALLAGQSLGSLVDPEPPRPEPPPPSMPKTVNVPLGPVARFHGQSILDMPVLVPHTARITMKPVDPACTTTLAATPFAGGKILVRWQNPNMACGVCVASIEVEG